MVRRRIEVIDAADLRDTHKRCRRETGTDIFSVSNARPLDRAVQHATMDTLNWLTADYGLSVEAASHLMGRSCYDVGNVYYPAHAMVCRIAKKWIATRSSGARGR